MARQFRSFRRGQFNPEEIPWNLILTIAPLVLIALGVAVLALDSFYTVEPHERAVVLRFGRFRPPVVEPGLRFKIPLVDRVLKVSIEEHSMRLPYGTERRPEAAPEEESLMLTGDLNAALVEWTVQWKVVEPEKFLFRFYHADDPLYAERVIRTVATSVMNRLVGDYSIDEILTEKRGELGEQARRATQQILDLYDCGLLIRNLQVQRSTPPAKVRPAFDEVNASLQHRDQLENEANKERNQLLPTAYAEKDKAIREAEGYAKRILAEAEGEIESLMARFREYQKAPEETRQRLYLETMEEVLDKVGSKVIIDSSLQQSVLPLLQLEAEGNQ